MAVRVPLLFSVLCLAPLSVGQHTAMSRQVTLSELTQEAGRIVHGNVVSSRIEAHPKYKNLKTVVVTMQVRDTLKGKAEKQFSFRQFVFGWGRSAGYAKGREVVLFLRPVNEEGVTAPAGGDQGIVQVEREQGREYASGMQRKVVLDAVSELARRNKAAPPSFRAAQLQQSPRVTLEDFKEVVREFARKESTR